MCIRDSLRLPPASATATTGRNLQTPPRQRHDLGLAVLALGAIRRVRLPSSSSTSTAFDVLLGDLFDDEHHVVGLVDRLNQLGVAGFEELEQGPDGDVLEGRVAGFQEAGEVAVDAARGLVPGGEEEGVVADCINLEWVS